MEKWDIWERVERSIIGSRGNERFFLIMKRVLIGIILIVFDMGVYLILGLLIMDYDDFYDASKSPDADNLQCEILYPNDSRFCAIKNNCHFSSD